MNTGLKLLNCNANIYFNKKCLEQNLTPKYAQTKIKVYLHNKTRYIKTINKFQKIHLKNEIKFWYIKKHLNKILYELRLENALKWNNLWNMIHSNIEMKTAKNEMNRNTTQHTFFKRMVNMTDITFSKDELHLLDKGLKYNLHRKPKTWIKI
jgi:nitric oxide reductase activation protein